MPVGSAIAAVMPDDVGALVGDGHQLVGEDVVHFSRRGGQQLAGLGVEGAAGPCRQSASSSSAGR